jgi:hypothetical protein
VGLTVFKTAGGALGASLGGFDTHTPLPFYMKCLLSSDEILAVYETPFLFKIARTIRSELHNSAIGHRTIGIVQI